MKVNTRKYPRTLNEAFGPYANLTPITDDDDDNAMAWAIFMIVLIVVVAVLAMVAL